MIKRLIGLVVAAAVIAIIVFAVINRHKYRSMIHRQTTEQTMTLSEPVSSAPPTSTSVRETRQTTAATDSLTLDRE